MNLVPNYYHKFKCIANKCKHNCCIGWEIDIDADTMGYYKQIGIDKIGYTDGVAHFELAEGDRCPYLLKSGLCEIISRFGEDALCDICADHPRFRNFYENFTEVGLGLCCEEAARIILGEKEPFTLLSENEITLTDQEEVIINFRNKLLDHIKDRSISIKERILIIKREFNIQDFSQKSLCDLYLSLERLDDGWTDVLNELRGYSLCKDASLGDEFEIPFEQLACYFIFRHLADAIWDGELVGRIKLSLAGCFLIEALCLLQREKYGKVTIYDMIDFARMYSAEVEYSEDNINKLIKEL